MQEPLPGHVLFGRRRRDGQIVGVLDVSRGDRCGCDCVICEQPLRANQGPNRQYFSHQPGVAAHCSEGPLHKAICEAMTATPDIDLVPLLGVPRLVGVQRVIRASGDACIAGQFHPDVLLDTAAGIRIAVEVVDTHPLSGFKLLALLQENLLVLLIDAQRLAAEIRREGASRQTLDRLIRRAGHWQAWPVLETMQQLDMVDSLCPWWDVVGEQPVRELRGVAAVRPLF